MLRRRRGARRYQPQRVSLDGISGDDRRGVGPRKGFGHRDDLLEFRQRGSGGAYPKVRSSTRPHPDLDGMNQIFVVEPFGSLDIYDRKVSGRAPDEPSILYGKP